MTLSTIMNIAATGMNAQTIRMNTAASNMANKNVIGSSEAGAYHARMPVFVAVELDKNGFSNKYKKSIEVGVDVTDIIQSNAPIQKEYSPNHELADENGYIYHSNVNTVEEMTNTLEASRDYQKNVQLMITAKQMLEESLRLLDV